MNPTKRKSSEPKTVYDSAWAAFERELQHITKAGLEAEGWRHIGDFSGADRNTVLKKAKNKGWECESFRVFTNGRIRQMTFIRPKVS